ncbi:CAP domain-containing protein [Sphingomonas sp. MA1305]|uniref:CAP domain-containing protein n=1 Tax=Sphingomonas sp. MA1305 TaxID=2479204 RepID=UPI0018E038BF|nr:CAP domain-containing protein [Sphingomonas sp. MA1305]
MALAGCGGSGSSGDSSATGAGSAVPIVTTPTPSPTPAPTASPTPSPTPAPTPTPTATPTTWAAAAAALYDVQPDATTCRAGTLKATVKADFLARLNAIRALHQLPAVTYSEAEDAAEADSSLMMAVNKQLSHTPPTSWTCYSASGATAAGSSNLIGGWGTGLGFDSEDSYLGLWLTEGGSASIGHRRWILDPFLGKTSYGRVALVLPDGSRASAASMRVFNFTTGVAVPTGLPAYVAYPSGDYPARYFSLSSYLSFSVVAGTSSAFGANANVRFTNATITVTGPSGALPVTDVTSDNDGYGVANNVQWRVTGLQTGVSYTVRITGVTGAPQSEYSYSFRVVS